MNRKALLAIVAATVTFSAPTFANELLLGFTGFDYHTALTSSTHYLDVGDSYSSLGFVTSVDPVLLGGHVDFGVNEYTYSMFNMEVQATFFSGNLLEADFSNNSSGRMRFYEDPSLGGTHAVYGTTPPNPSAPSTFTDGAIALGGRIYNMVVTYDFGAGQGTFSGSIDLDEGTDLIYIPPSQRSGWALGADAGTQIIPQGFDHQVAGQCQIPSVTPATHMTWGAIKRLYR